MLTFVDDPRKLESINLNVKELYQSEIRTMQDKTVAFNKMDNFKNEIFELTKLSFEELANISNKVTVKEIQHDVRTDSECGITLSDNSLRLASLLVRTGDCGISIIITNNGTTICNSNLSLNFYYDNRLKPDTIKLFQIKTLNAIKVAITQIIKSQAKRDYNS